MNPDINPQPEPSPPSEARLDESRLTDQLFEAFHEPLSIFPETVIEKVSGMFISQNVYPGPGTSEILAFFRALVEQKSREVLYVEAQRALDDGMLPQLFSETLDRALLVEISKDLILSAIFNNGLERPYDSDAAVFIFESPEMLQALGLEFGLQAYWHHHYEDTDIDLGNDLAMRFDRIQSECLDHARLCRSLMTCKSHDSIREFFGAESVINQYLESNYSDAQVYLIPLSSGSMYLGSLMVFHSGEQCHGSRLGAELSLIGSALSVGFKRIVEVFKLGQNT